MNGNMRRLAMAGTAAALSGCAGGPGSRGAKPSGAKR